MVGGPDPARFPVVPPVALTSESTDGLRRHRFTQDEAMAGAVLGHVSDTTVGNPAFNSSGCGYPE